jgi:hypothetical protein
VGVGYGVHVRGFGGSRLCSRGRRSGPYGFVQLGQPRESHRMSGDMMPAPKRLVASKVDWVVSPWRDPVGTLTD